MLLAASVAMKKLARSASSLAGWLRPERPPPGLIELFKGVFGAHPTRAARFNFALFTPEA